MSITSSNAILNQWTPTFCVSNVVGGQTLVYDPNKRAFVNAFSSGTGGVSSLDQLSDVHINPLTLMTGQVLTWNGPDNWTNSYVDYNSLTNAPVLAAVATSGSYTDLINKPTSADYSFIGLNDVTHVAVGNGYVLWNSLGTQLVYSATIPASSITGLAPVATIGTLDSLNDVTVASPAVGQTIQYNGSTWVNAAPNLNVEKVVFRYSAGASGTFAVADPIYSTTAGITATITDPLNCIVRFSFVGYKNPPSSIMYYGQATSTNKFTITTVQSSALANRYVTDTGTVSSPNLINNIFAPNDTITLQLRPADTSSSGALGVRAYCVILFKF